MFIAQVGSYQTYILSEFSCNSIFSGCEANQRDHGWCGHEQQSTLSARHSSATEDACSVTHGYTCLQSAFGDIWQTAITPRGKCIPIWKKYKKMHGISPTHSSLNRAHCWWSDRKYCTCIVFCTHPQPPSNTLILLIQSCMRSVLVCICGGMWLTWLKTDGRFLSNNTVSSYLSVPSSPSWYMYMYTVVVMETFTEITLPSSFF